MQPAPVIYINSLQSQALSIKGRFLALLVALACLAPLVVAAALKPSHTGTGTHTHLGLAECQWLARTGLPCPSCGMTTSWTWFVRGNLAASLYVQPMGPVLAALAVCSFWGGLYASATGRAVYRLLGAIAGRYYFVPLMTIALAAWAWKIFIHLSGKDGW